MSALRQHREALELVCRPYSVSRETLDAMSWYANEVFRWQGHINLVSGGDRLAIWERHIIDSAQTYPIAIQRGLTEFVDLGSGAGFPGLVLAILGAEHDLQAVQLIESNGKKASFLRHCIRYLSLRANVVEARISDVEVQTTSAGVCVTSRALTRLDKLLGYARPWFERGAVGLFHKGIGVEQECSEAEKVWNFEAVCHTSLTDSSGCILEIRNVRSRS